MSDSTICGHTIQHDNSGVGHNWRNIAAEDIPANVRQEIECEIIDGEREECDAFVASNGLHYRWLVAELVEPKATWQDYADVTDTQQEAEILAALANGEITEDQVRAADFGHLLE